VLLRIVVLLLHNKEGAAWAAPVALLFEMASFYGRSTAKIFTTGGTLRLRSGQAQEHGVKPLETAIVVAANTNGAGPRAAPLFRLYNVIISCRIGSNRHVSQLYFPRRINELAGKHRFWGLDKILANLKNGGFRLAEGKFLWLPLFPAGIWRLSFCLRKTFGLHKKPHFPQRTREMGPELQRVANLAGVSKRTNLCPRNSSKRV
jgi:hypothetical protein